MSSRKAANAAVIAGAMALAALAVRENMNLTSAAQGEAPLPRERCYGVAREGKNDCGTPRHSCAGRAVRNADTGEWLMVPAGLCRRLVHGLEKAGTDQHKALP